MPTHRYRPIIVELDYDGLCSPLLYVGQHGKCVWNNGPPPTIAQVLKPNGTDTYASTINRLETSEDSGLAAYMYLEHCRVRLNDGSERPGCMIVVDQELLELAMQQRLLAEERLHRARNMLNIVNIIASQTLGSHLPPANLHAFLDRLQSLQTALSAACDATGDECDVVEIVARVIGRFCHPDDARVRCAGPALKLPARWSASLTLALHELATNAMKYGALSVTGGTVTLEWHRTGSAAKPLLCLMWRERGGPPVEQPSRRGFGSTLIRGVFGGHPRCSADLDFARSGLMCRICLPLYPTTGQPGG